MLGQQPDLAAVQQSIELARLAPQSPNGFLVQGERPYQTAGFHPRGGHWRCEKGAEVVESRRRDDAQNAIADATETAGRISKRRGEAA